MCIRDRYIDGVYQHKDTYSLSNTTLTFSTAPPNLSDIEVISFSSVSSADDILYDDDFTSAGLMKTDGSGTYSIVTDNSSNWNTAYTYSQVGHLPLAGGTLTGNLIVGGDISIPVSNSLYFGGGSHTYIREDIDDRLRFFVGGAEFMRFTEDTACLLYTSPSPRDATLSRMPSSA